MKRNRTQKSETVHFTEAGGKGKGVATLENGKKVFVKYAVPGDTAEILITKNKSKYAEGKLTQILTPSELRRAPKCRHFGVCGGCSWQNMNYGAQLNFKEKEVLDNIRKIAGIIPENTHKIVGADKEYGYRNKMEFSFSASRWVTEEEISSGEEITDRDALGFHIPGMWSKVLDLKECYLQTEPSDEMRLFVNHTAQSLGIPYYHLHTGEGVLRSIMFRNTHEGKWLVFFQITEKPTEVLQNLFDTLIQKFSNIQTLLFAVNTKQNDSIYDLDIETYYGEGFLMEEMFGLKFKIGAKSFFQTNYDQAKKLYELTLEAAGLTGKEIVYDLYCGTGTITQILATRSQKVLGIEAVPEAVEAAKLNVQLNGINNCEFICGDMKNVFTKEVISTFGKADVLVTDPPRDGMHGNVIEQILELRPPKIVYVSCNSATQARDIASMKEHYRLTQLIPVDLFPQTFHSESIAVLELIS